MRRSEFLAGLATIPLAIKGLFGLKDQGSHSTTTVTMPPVTPDDEYCVFGDFDVDVKLSAYTKVIIETLYDIPERAKGYIQFIHPDYTIRPVRAKIDGTRLICRLPIDLRSGEYSVASMLTYDNKTYFGQTTKLKI